MALPAQALEKLSHVSERTPGVYSQLLILTTSLMILALFMFAGLKFGYEPYLVAEVKQLDADIKKFSDEIPADKQAEIATFYSQIINLKTVLRNHQSASPFWFWLEKNTIPNVYFTKATLNITNDQIILQGSARTNEDIMNQLAAFEKSPEVTKLTFGNSQNTATGWQFSLTLNVDKNFFRGFRTQ